MNNIFNDDYVIPYRDRLINFLSSFINVNDLSYKSTSELEDITNNVIEYNLPSDNKVKLNYFEPNTIQKKPRRIFFKDNNKHLDKFEVKNQSLGFGGLKYNNNDNFELDIIDKRYPKTVEKSIEDILYPTMKDFNTKKKLSLLDKDMLGIEEYREIDESGYSNEPGHWIMPCRGRISSYFGWRVHPVLKEQKYHNGLDIAAPTGTPIYTPANGRVKFAGYDGTNGNCIRIDYGIINGKRITCAMAHLEKIHVKEGENVIAGTQIGTVGSTGKYKNGKSSSTGPHLHISIYENGIAVNPYNYIRKH